MMSFTASRLLVWAGFALIGAVIAGMAAFAWYEYHETLDEEVDRNQLLARLIEGHASTTVESATIVMASVADMVASRLATGDTQRLDALMTQSLPGLPFLRSIALLDRQGRVVASSSADDAGRTVPLQPLGVLPAVDRDAIGPLLRGRGVADLAGPPASTGIAFVPLLRSLSDGRGGTLLLVGLLNPDTFATYQASSLEGEPAGTWGMLTSYRGQVLASTRTAPVEPGEDVSSSAVFRQGLPEREHGALEEVRGDVRELVAFRASRSLPLVVVVKRPHAAVLAQWREDNQPFLLFATVGVVVVAGMLSVAARSLRAREEARLQLDEAQTRVAESERELSVLVRSVQELIFRTDAQGNVTFVNTRWSALSGRTTAEALGQCLWDIATPASRPVLHSLFRLDRDDAVRTAPDVAVNGPGGAERLFDVAVVPLREGSRISGFAGSAVDVTDRRRAERQLKAQLSFTGLLLEISPLPVAMTSADGRLVTVNQAWEEFTGHDRTEVLGQPANRYLPGTTEDDSALGLPHGGDRASHETRVRHADGSRRDVVVTQVNVPSEGRSSAGRLSVFMDVSEYREAERATREARDAAEEASRAKSEFIANISHEMRTPLQAIMGFSELGVMRSRAHEKLADLFQDIHSAGERMLAVVNDLLDVAKIESAVGTFHLERTDLRGLVRAVARELAPLLDRKQLTLDLALSDTPLLAKVDPTRVQQVFRNVLANAIRFSPAGQTLQLSGHAEEAREIRFELRDHGPGIPEAELDKIFEAFVQSSKTKDGSGGTGLGLAICRKILDAHGGAISARNAPGGGAVFSITLPANASGETLPAPLGGS
ncbi:ATP-binding protein [Rhizobacter sp. LjRoot28]|uniref:ATP-binding protein n=1 Tax=Rhizobacter sp. LjRoot28 TaxID=3342309 RepID=UPI003ED01DAD